MSSLPGAQFSPVLCRQKKMKQKSNCFRRIKIILTLFFIGLDSIKNEGKSDTVMIMTGAGWTPFTYGLGLLIVLIVQVLTYFYVQFKIEMYKDKDLKEFRAKFIIGIPMALAGMSVIILFKILDNKFGDDYKVLILHLVVSIAVGIVEPLIIIWKHPSMNEYCSKKILQFFVKDPILCVYVNVK